MIKSYYFLIFFYLFSLTIQAQQIEANTELHFNGDSYRICKIPITNETAKNFKIIENKSQLTHKDFIESKMIEPNCFMINASISDSSCNPIGYYVRDFQVIKPINLTDGSGNFYLKPNGAILFTANDIVVCESSQIRRFTNVRLGVQSGPMLVNAGITNSQFNPSSQNKNIRCGVGIFVNQKNERILVFAVANNAVTLYSFAQFFLNKLKCTNALCLESGNCVIGLPYISAETEYNSNVICNYLYLPN